VRSIDEVTQVGAWLGYAVFDPLGGLLVAGMILKNGAEVGITALKELLGRSTIAHLPSPSTDDTL
jgi:divalent metal cation (Fe/Co/Zn/Cd) transporter